MGWTISPRRHASFKGVGFSLALLLSLRPEMAMSMGQECMASYSRTRSPACVDGILAEFRQPNRAATDPSTLIGFLAELFESSPQERNRILSAETSDHLKSVELVSLYRAGLPDEAETFARTNNLSAVADKVRAMQLVALEAVRPSSTPADNDLMIGAYMASGNTVFIQRVLDNYSSAEDGMVSDGLRMGFMLSKFGANLTPAGREPVMARAIRDKYQSKSDLSRILRVMTLGTASWSLQSLSQQDDRIKKTFANFLANDTRLKSLFAIEQNAFANYVTAIVALTALKDQPSPGLPSPGLPNPGLEAMRKSVEIYEKLGPANEAFAPMANTKK